MLRTAQQFLLPALLVALSALTAFAQATGTIVGTVTDSSGAAIPNAPLTVANKATGAARTITASAEGLYSAPALEAGQYEVRSEIAGFRTLVRDAQVQAGENTTVDLQMQLGEAREVVNVEAATAQINYETHTVEGEIQRNTIQELPLNGRSFLQLATLEPGVTITAAATSSRNNPMTVTILGGGGGFGTRLTLDGLSILDEFDGSMSLNFSQEIVQEFQVSQANFDLSTGVGTSGAINMVTRSGTNDFHGSAFFFFRDHNMAAYPALKRNALNPNPFFSRRDPGFWLSGPIFKNKFFFFFNFEDQHQTSAVTVQPDLASAAGSAGIFPSPLFYKSLTARFDYQLSDKESLFLRYTHDGNVSFGVNSGLPFPSDWLHNDNWSDQYVVGITSLLTPNIVNDFRLAYRYWRNNSTPPTEALCPNCLGLGFPQTQMVGSSNWEVGNNGNGPQNLIRRTPEFQDVLTWQRGKHRLKFGFDLDWYMNTFQFPICAPACMSVYSVETTKSVLGAATSTYLPNLPTTVSTNSDILNLPVYFTTAGLYSGIGAGPAFLPGAYNFNSERRNFRPRWFGQDTWKLKKSLTVNYGLAYSFDTGVTNSDIPLPQIEAVLYGAHNLAPTPPNWRNFAPAFGFAWSPGATGKMVIRGGAGLYWDTWPLYWKANQTWSVDPIGDGRAKLYSTSFLNTFPGIVQQGPGGMIVPLPIGSPLPVTAFTTLTMGQWLQIYKDQYPAVSAMLTRPNPQTSGPIVPGTQVMDYTKTGAELFPPHMPDTHSYQTSIGVQRDLGHDMVLTADWARRQAVHTNAGEIDAVQFSNFVNGVRMPKAPVCTPAQFFVPAAQCATGSFTTFEPWGRSVYEGLLLKVAKRFTHRYQFTLSYALQNLNSTASTPVNLNNYFESYGPTLARQNLNVSGLVNLPWGFELGFNSSIITRSPITPATTNIDLSGTGSVSGGPITVANVPGVTYDCFNQGCGASQLVTAVEAFNTAYAGERAPNGTTIKPYVLPPSYRFGKPTISQDLRLTKTFSFRERYRFALLAEMFNVLNIANLTGYSYNLDTLGNGCQLRASGSAFTDCSTQTYGFGQPTQRAAQTFFSGGPRAVQVGGRFTF